MPIGIYEKDDIDDIANRIRRYTNTEAKYTTKQMPPEIDSVYNKGITEGKEQGKAEREAVTKSIIDRTITELVVPNGTDKIGNYTFSYCTSLKKITIPEGVTSIGANALNATSLSELILPLSCATLSTYSLYSIYNLKKIIFGDVKSISSNAIGANQYCTLYDFSRCTTIPTLSNVNAFSQIATNAQIIVPAALYDEWIVATNWSQLASYIVAKE